MEKKIIQKKEKGLNRHWKNFIDKDYLGSHNLEKGEELLVTIEKFEGEEMVQKVGTNKDEKTPKPVLYFKENVPKMILNMTNAGMLETLYGSHPANWVGKKIQIHTAKVKAFGKEQDALRIRDFIPKHEIDLKKVKEKLSTAKDMESLKTIWSSLSESERKNEEIIKYKDEIKKKYENS